MRKTAHLISCVIHTTDTNSYLQKSQLVQEAAQVCDDFGASYKLLPHIVIENQIQIPLAESCFLWEKDCTVVRNKCLTNIGHFWCNDMPICLLSINTRYCDQIHSHVNLTMQSFEVLHLWHCIRRWLILKRKHFMMSRIAFELKRKKNHASSSEITAIIVPHKLESPLQAHTLL